MEAYWALKPHRRAVLRAGRRFGKTDFGGTMATHAVTRGKPVGWFAPDYKRLVPAYDKIRNWLEPVTKNASQTAGRIRTITDGEIDFWTLGDQNAGRSRGYALAVIDEAAFTDSNMMDMWKKAIQPTLLEHRGSALVMSNTNGIDAENFLWCICNQPEHGFHEFHASSRNNPMLPADEIEQLRLTLPPLVFSQEYEAEFVDWSGTAFFSREKLLHGGQPVEFPRICDAVLSVVDTAVKTGKENDGTAVSWWAYSRTNYGGVSPLVLLDWDYVQLEGALLDGWLPDVFKRGEQLAGECRARSGYAGCWIEDKSSGMVLLQQAAQRGWPARGIDSKLTAAGKAERAINISGYVHQEKVKFSRQAYDRVQVFKGVSRNHMLDQVVGFRIGSKEQVNDDLLDTFCYAVAIALGNDGGF